MAGSMSGLSPGSVSLEELVKCSKQIEQNTRSEQTAVLYKTRKELGAKKVLAKIRSNIHAITDIDNVRQEFTARLKVSIRWKEPLMKGWSPTQEIDWDDQWSPRIELENAVKITNLDRKFHLEYFDSTDKKDNIPHVCLDMAVSATFKEMFELEEFPFDYQALNVWLVCEWPFDQVEMITDADFMDHISVNTFTESAEWTLSGHLIGAPVGVPQPVNDVIGSSENFSLYSITAHICRLSKFYVFQHFLPLFLVHLLAFAAFAIAPDTENTAGRLGVASLCMVLTFTLRYTLDKGLPNVAYMSFYDKYYLFLLISNCVILAEMAIIGKISQFVSSDVTVIVDYCVLGATLLVSVGVHCYVGAVAVEMIKKRGLFLKEELTHYYSLCEKVWNRYLASNPTARRQSRPNDQGANGQTTVYMPSNGRDLLNPVTNTHEVRLTSRKSKRRRGRSHSRSRSAVRPEPSPDRQETRVIASAEYSP